MSLEEKINLDKELKKRNKLVKSVLFLLDKLDKPFFSLNIKNENQIKQDES